ncbi:MAG: adenylyl-sulfate kinase [Actinomycetota bacterium]
MRPAFAVWFTGLPSSGKSTVSAALAAELSARGVDVAILESDALRRVFTPRPAYTEEERDVFYHAVAYVGKLLVEHGVPVIFDATANRRSYRECARQSIPRFLEVYVDCPLDVCMKRDVKGIYKKAKEGATSTVPGLQAVYEPPENPDLVISGNQESPGLAAQRVLNKLIEQRYL